MKYDESILSGGQVIHLSWWELVRVLFGAKLFDGRATLWRKGVVILSPGEFERRKKIVAMLMKSPYDALLTGA